MPGVPIGITGPGQYGEGVNSLVPGSPIQGTQPASNPGAGVRDAVWLHSDDPVIDVVARMAGKPSSTFPQPQYDQAARPGAFGLTRYRGHDPYTMTLPILLEDGGRNVEAAVRKLEQLAERAPGVLEPPVVSVQGTGVPHSGLRWRVQLPADADQTHFNAAGARIAVWVTLTLMQQVTDTLLGETLRTGKGAKGLTRKRTTVRAGETSLHDVARRVYGDPFRAGDIATENRLRIGARLRTGQSLRLP